MSLLLSYKPNPSCVRITVPRSHILLAFQAASKTKSESKKMTLLATYLPTIKYSFTVWCPHVESAFRRSMNLLFDRALNNLLYTAHSLLSASDLYNVYAFRIDIARTLPSLETSWKHLENFRMSLRICEGKKIRRMANYELLADCSLSLKI